MSTQHFSNAFREALWETYHKKCFYCGGELLLKAMHIDHLLPENLGNDAALDAELRQRVGIERSFNILGFENLVPTCLPCNTKKGELILADGSLAIFLAKIKRSMPLLEAAIEKKRTERDLESTLRFIARAIDKGKYSPEELNSGIRLLMQSLDRISVSSPVAVPASPETIKYGIKISDQTQIIWTHHALMQMSSRNFTIQEITRAIFEHGRVSKIHTHKLAGHDSTYVIRAPGNLRVVFKPLEDGVKILTVFQADTSGGMC